MTLSAISGQAIDTTDIPPAPQPAAAKTWTVYISAPKSPESALQNMDSLCFKPCLS